MAHSAQQSLGAIFTEGLAGDARQGWSTRVWAVSDRVTPDGRGFTGAASGDLRLLDSSFRSLYTLPSATSFAPTEARRGP
jgi:hypothetical protein